VPVPSKWGGCVAAWGGKKCFAAVILACLPAVVLKRLAQSLEFHLLYKSNSHPEMQLQLDREGFFIKDFGFLLRQLISGGVKRAGQGARSSDWSHLGFDLCLVTKHNRHCYEDALSQIAQSMGRVASRRLFVFCCVALLLDYAFANETWSGAAKQVTEYRCLNVAGCLWKIEESTVKVNAVGW